MRLKTNLPILTIIVYIGAATAAPVFSADISINEFLADLPSGQDENQDEWVELYNHSDTDINLHGWVLKDSDDSHQRLIENTTIPAHGYLVITRNGSLFSLNNSGDQVRLFESTASANPVDSFTYTASTEGKSWGRIPNYSGDFINNLTPTPGSENIAPPTPTPTPTATPSPNTDSNSTASTPKPSPTPDSSPSQTTTGSVAGLTTSRPATASTQAANLQIRDIIPASSASAIASTTASKSSSITAKPSFTPLFITLGGLVVTSAVAVFVWKLYNSRSWQ